MPFGHMRQKKYQNRQNNFQKGNMERICGNRRKIMTKLTLVLETK